MKKYFIVLYFLTALYLFSANKSDAPARIIFYLWEDQANHFIVNTYNSIQKEIFVDAQYIPLSEYENKISTLLAAGIEIDAYMMKRQSDSFIYLANGYLYPLNDLIKNSKEKIPSVSNYKNGISVDGKIVGIPFRGSGWFTYYNKKIFVKKGIPTPDKYVKNGTWTWDKFIETAKALSSGNDKIYGAFIYYWGASQIIPCLQNGMQFITNDGKIDINEKIFLKSFRMRKSLDKKAIFPFIEMKVTKTHYSSAFYNGNIGMLLMGEWFPNNMRIGKDNNLFKDFNWNDWSVTRLPCDEKEYRSFGNPTYNSIHPNSLKKEAAFKFISWMGSPKGAEVIAKIGSLPATITPEVKQIFADLIPDKSGIDYYFEPKKTNSQFLNKYGSKIESAIEELMENYLERNISDGELITLLKDKLNDIIKMSE